MQYTDIRFPHLEIYLTQDGVTFTYGKFRFIFKGL